jgi:hypothetical protein
MRGKLPSQQTQRSQLKKKGIDVGRVKGKWTLYRLYNYYVTQHHPKSDPRYLAYSTRKRFESRVMTHPEPERLKVKTGSGRTIPYKTIVVRERRRIDKQTEQTLMPNMSVKLNRHLAWSKKMLDVLRVEMNVKFTEDNYRKKLDEVAHYLHEVVVPAVDKMMEIRHQYYAQGEHLFGVKVNWKASDMMKTTDDTGMEVMVDEFHSTVVYQPLHYKSEYRERRMFEAIERGALKVFDYKNLDVTLTNIEIAFITRGYEEGIERLRA